MTKEYRVQIEIDVDADNPDKAALAAYEALRDPECLPWVCEVWDVNTSRETAVQVDLERVLEGSDFEQLLKLEPPAAD